MRLGIFNFRARKPIPPHEDIGALLDSSTNALLTLSNNISALVIVNEGIADSTIAPVVNLPNYRTDFPLLKSRARWPEWTWIPSTRIFMPTLPEIVTPSLRERSKLATRKLSAAIFMFHRLNILRDKLRTGVIFQETVYLAKEMQARRLKESGFDPTLIMESPYVVYYADYADISIEQACEEILLQAKLDHERLAITENIRLRKFGMLKKAKTIAEVDHVLSDFSGVPPRHV